MGSRTAAAWEGKSHSAHLHPGNDDDDDNIEGPGYEPGANFV